MTRDAENKHPLRFTRDGAKKMLPRAAVNFIQRITGQLPPDIPLGSVRFGDLKRLAPISKDFGWGRGTPIDRLYIEAFLSRHAGDIRGRVLEIGDNVYTQRFGGARVEQSDILSVESFNPKATFVGDLTRPETLPEAAFDCIVFTQTLQYIFDTRAAVTALSRAVRPGGVLLLTVPAAGSQVDGSAWGATWYWWFTLPAVRRLLEISFPQDAVAIETYGNIFAATAFRYGLVLEDLELSDLDVSDPEFPVIVAARAVKAHEPA
jgi:SAM-dependent methyltransferase